MFGGLAAKRKVEAKNRRKKGNSPKTTIKSIFGESPLFGSFLTLFFTSFLRKTEQEIERKMSEKP